MDLPYCAPTPRDDQALLVPSLAFSSGCSLDLRCHGLDCFLNGEQETKWIK